MEYGINKAWEVGEMNLGYIKKHLSEIEKNARDESRCKNRNFYDYFLSHILSIH